MQLLRSVRFENNREMFKQQTPPTPLLTPTCTHCGHVGHGSSRDERSDHCSAYRQTCTKCGKHGHFAAVCRQQSTSGTRHGQLVRELRDFWFKFFQKHQIWLICPLWHTVSIFAGRQDERPLAGRHFEEKKHQDGRHFSPNMYDTTCYM